MPNERTHQFNPLKWSAAAAILIISSAVALNIYDACQFSYSLSKDSFTTGGTRVCQKQEDTGTVTKAVLGHNSLDMVEKVDSIGPVSEFPTDSTEPYAENEEAEYEEPKIYSITQDDATTEATVAIAQSAKSEEKSDLKSAESQIIQPVAFTDISIGETYYLNGELYPKQFNAPLYPEKPGIFSSKNIGFLASGQPFKVLNKYTTRFKGFNWLQIEFDSDSEILQAWLPWGALETPVISIP